MGMHDNILRNALFCQSNLNSCPRFKLYTRTVFVFLFLHPFSEIKDVLPKSLNY